MQQEVLWGDLPARGEEVPAHSGAQKIVFLGKSSAQTAIERSGSHSEAIVLAWHTGQQMPRQPAQAGNRGGISCHVAKTAGNLACNRQTAKHRHVDNCSISSRISGCLGSLVVFWNVVVLGLGNCRAWSGGGVFPRFQTPKPGYAAPNPKP